MDIDKICVKTIYRVQKYYKYGKFWSKILFSLSKFFSAQKCFFFFL